jgi:hypothetical protein
MDICSAILKINPTAQVSVNAEDLEQITWHSGTPEIPKADIVAMMAELKADYDNKQYQRDRKPKYPDIGDQLDMIYHAGLGGDEFQEAIKTVKEKYPKE